MKSVTADMLAAGTPAEIEVRAEPMPPNIDPTLGIPLEVPRGPVPLHRLVVVGDSLSQGVMSGAVHLTSLSYPAIVAQKLGLGLGESFRFPRYDGPGGGLPLNIETFVRELESRYGGKLNCWEAPGAFVGVRRYLDKIEDYWERGSGSRPPKETIPYHNLAISGWDLRDALSVTAEVAEERIKSPKDDFWHLQQKVENSGSRIALAVLSSLRADGIERSVLDGAILLGEQGQVGEQEQGSQDVPGQNASGREERKDGIETLIVCLGCNNVLGSVGQLRIRWSGEGYDDLQEKENFTIWRPSHFAQELAHVVAKVEKVRARHVIWTTVPHVTVAPVARGVGKKINPYSRYYPHYTRPWISDANFDSGRDPRITSQEARAADSVIDQYNASIIERVRDARSQGRDWLLLDISGILDRLAFRRYQDNQGARPEWWQPYELPAELTALDPVPDTRFYQSGSGGRSAGGFFSLDGIHPTTIGYGIFAQECITVMQQAGVVFRHSDGTPRTGAVKVDFAELVKRDSLLSEPLQSLDRNLGLLGWADQALDLFHGLFR